MAIPWSSAASRSSASRSTSLPSSPRHPVYLGLFFACNTMIVWDWIFNCKWFFNVAWDPRLTKLWVVQGEGETLAAGLAFVAFYYWVFHLLWTHQARLDARLGARQFALLYAGFMIYDLVFEGLLVQAGLYRYYQREPFLLFGVAWSNMIFNANLSVCFATQMIWYAPGG